MVVVWCVVAVVVVWVGSREGCEWVPPADLSRHLRESDGGVGVWLGVCAER